MPRARFSILTMLVLVALVAVGLAMYRQWVAWPAAEAEYKALIQSDPSPKQVVRLKSLVQQYPILAKTHGSMHYAVGTGDASFCRLLAERGAAINESLHAKWNKPFFHAIVGGHPDVVQTLIDFGVDPSTGDSLDEWERHFSPPIHLVVWRKDVDVGRVLVESGADINAKSEADESPLELAIRIGDPDMAQLLLEHGAVVDFGKQTFDKFCDAIRETSYSGPNSEQRVEEICELLQAYRPQLEAAQTEGAKP